MDIRGNHTLLTLHVVESKRRIFPPSLLPESSTLAFHFSCCFLGCGRCCHSYVDRLIIQCMNAYSQCQGLFQNQPCGKQYQGWRGREVDWRKTRWNKELQKDCFIIFFPSKLLEAPGFVPPCELPSLELPKYFRRAWVDLHRGRFIYRLQC